MATREEILVLFSEKYPAVIRKNADMRYEAQVQSYVLQLTMVFLDLVIGFLIQAFIWKLIGRESEFAFIAISEEVMISYFLSSAVWDLNEGFVKRNNYSRSRPGNSLVKLMDKLLGAHISNGGTRQKAAIPGKHRHNRGHGRDGSGKKRTIQDDWVIPGTAASSSSVQMTSLPPQTPPQIPPPPTAPLQTPQSPTPTPQVQLTQTPPLPTAPPQTPQSPTAPPPPPPPPTPPQAVGWFGFNFAGGLNFNFAGLAKIFLAISATLVLAPAQIVHSGTNSLSANDKTLLFGTKVFGFTGFICCLLGYNVRQDNIAAKVLTAFGCVANIFGLLLIVALGR